MSILRSNTAPYLLALIVSALGWYVGQIDREIRNARSAVFTVTRGADDKSVTVDIENVSRTQALKDFQFAVVCKEGMIAPGTAPNTGLIVLRPPVQPIMHVVRHDPGQVTVDASLAPGGIIGLSAELKDCQSTAEFFYKPQGNQQLYMLDSDSVTGFVVKNYNKILVVSFVVFLLAFAGWLTGSAYHSFRRKGHEHSEEGRVYRVELALVGSGDRADGTGRPRGEGHGGGHGQAGGERGPEPGGPRA